MGRLMGRVAHTLSQFFSAVADTMTATGNMEETTQGHLKACFAAALAFIAVFAVPAS
jgi:hypothetical protein